MPAPEGAETAEIARLLAEIARLLAEIDRLTTERDACAAEAAALRAPLSEALRHLPGAVLTRDRGSCEACTTETYRGQTLCPRCLRSGVLNLLNRPALAWSRVAAAEHAVCEAALTWSTSIEGDDTDALLRATDALRAFHEAEREASAGGRS